MTDINAAAQLQARHQREAVFHDHLYAEHSAVPRHYRVNPTYPVFKRMLALLGDDLSGKRVLEYGCGNGWVTLELARRGAHVSAFDISKEGVVQTRHALRDAGLEHRCDVDVMAGERLTYADRSFDIAIGFAILHHLDLDAALPELHRVLKPGGQAVFGEPLASNPLVRLYRRLTPQFRTPDEAPLDLEEVRRRAAGFTRYRHDDQLLLAMAALTLCYVPGGDALARPLQRALMRADDVLIRMLPRLGTWAWYSILVFQR
jgi:SAM-dependent methyltransferase